MCLLGPLVCFRACHYVGDSLQKDIHRARWSNPGSPKQQAVQFAVASLALGLGKEK